MLIQDYIKLHPKSLGKPLPDLARRCVIVLGGQKNPLPYLLPHTIVFDPSIQVCASISVHPILVNDEEHVIGSREAISGEVALARYVGNVARVFAEV